MTPNFKLLDLPELVLYNICTYLTSPFDLLHFGNTCTKLRKISSSQSLWWSLALDWCEGLWMSMPESITGTHPREWLWQVISRFNIRSSGTELKCNYSGGETWERVESTKFRCLFGMLYMFYKKKDPHPAVLYEDWLYDIGLYQRINPCINFGQDVPENAILTLAALGQASERDLRRRKQPNKNPKYYVKHVQTVEKNWRVELFPSGPHGSTCPFLMQRYQNADNGEISGYDGVAVCLALVLGDIVKFYCKSFLISLSRIYKNITYFCDQIIFRLTVVVPHINDHVKKMSLKDATVYAIKEKYINIEQLQENLNELGIALSYNDVLQRFSDFLKSIKDIDSVVDKVPSRIRRAMLGEINKVLFLSECSDGHVTRMNLTDSDFIGGDNSRQEMAAAAFISAYGSLVTWHLTGQIRF